MARSIYQILRQVQHQIEQAGIEINIDEFQNDIKQICLILDLNKPAREQPHKLAQVCEEIGRRYPLLSTNERIMEESMRYARAYFSQHKGSFKRHNLGVKIRLNKLFTYGRYYPLPDGDNSMHCSTYKSGKVLQHGIEQAGLAINIDELQKNIKQITLILDVNKTLLQQPNEWVRVCEEIGHHYPLLSANEGIMEKAMLYAWACFFRHTDNSRRVNKQSNKVPSIQMASETTTTIQTPLVQDNGGESTEAFTSFPLQTSTPIQFHQQYPQDDDTSSHSTYKPSQSQTQCTQDDIKIEERPERFCKRHFALNINLRHIYDLHRQSSS